MERVFELTAPTMEVRIAGQTITTTGKHPFFVIGKGWVPAARA